MMCELRISEPEHCVIKRVDFPSESNTQETPCQDEHLQAPSAKSIPRLLICGSESDRSPQMLSPVHVRYGSSTDEFTITC